MANICENQLTVSGPNVKAFHDRFKGKPAKWDANSIQEECICFNALIPVPQKVIEDGYAVSGYDWCNKNWGVKWDICGNVYIEEEPNEDSDTVKYEFDTPWCPPEAWLEKVAPMFPELNFTLIYGEIGCEIGGEIEFIGDNKTEIQYCIDEIKQFVGYIDD